MDKNNNTIICPNCLKKINVNDVIYNQLEEQIQVNGAGHDKWNSTDSGCHA
jgi:hypothetical protein